MAGRAGRIHGLGSMLPEAALLRQKRVIRDTGGLVFRDPIELGPREKPRDLARVVVEQLTHGGLSGRLLSQQDLAGHRFYIGVRQLDIEDEAILQLGEIGSRGGQC